MNWTDEHEDTFPKHLWDSLTIEVRYVSPGGKRQWWARKVMSSKEWRQNAAKIDDVLTLLAKKAFRELEKAGAVER